jgi:hypothetical protein
MGVRDNVAPSNVAPPDHDVARQGDALRVAAIDHVQHKIKRARKRRRLEQGEVFSLASDLVERDVEALDIFGDHGRDGDVVAEGNRHGSSRSAVGGTIYPIPREDAKAHDRQECATRAAFVAFAESRRRPRFGETRHSRGRSKRAARLAGGAQTKNRGGRVVCMLLALSLFGDRKESNSAYHDERAHGRCDFRQETIHDRRNGRNPSAHP